MSNYEKKQTDKVLKDIFFEQIINSDKKDFLFEEESETIYKVLNSITRSIKNTNLSKDFLDQKNKDLQNLSSRLRMQGESDSELKNIIKETASIISYLKLKTDHHLTLNFAAFKHLAEQKINNKFISLAEQALKSIENEDYSSASDTLKSLLMASTNPLNNQEISAFQDISTKFDFQHSQIEKMFNRIKVLYKLVKEQEYIKTTDMYFEESESFEKNITGAIKSVLTSNFKHFNIFMDTAISHLESKNEIDFKINDFNKLLNLIKVVRIIDAIKITLTKGNDNLSIPL